MIHLDIKLNKSEYIKGETVEGILVLSTNKAINAKRFDFVAYGEEKTRLISSPNKDKYYKNNIFFSKDLSSCLSSEDGVVLLPDKTLQITEGLETTIPFQFVIPEDVLESYNGENVWIYYGIKVTLFMNTCLRPYKKQISFVVLAYNEPISIARW